MSLYESAENYLETILILNKRLGAIRSIDIVSELDFSRPSVSVAMKKLRESGYINVDHDGHITLTESGAEIAESVYERHTILSDFLTGLGVDADIAAEDACRMEHMLHQQTFEKIRDHVARNKGERV